MLSYNMVPRIPSPQFAFEEGVQARVTSEMYLQHARISNEFLTPHERSLIFTMSDAPAGVGCGRFERSARAQGWFYASFLLRSARLNIVILPMCQRRDLALAQAFIYEIRSLDFNCTNDFHAILSPAKIDEGDMTKAWYELVRRARAERLLSLPWTRVICEGEVPDGDGTSYKYRLDKGA